MVDDQAVWAVGKVEAFQVDLQAAEFQLQVGDQQADQLVELWVEG